MTEAFRYSAPTAAGGLAEEMYARAAVVFTGVGPGSGAVVATPWSAPSLDTYGTAPPTIQAVPYDYELRVNASGYHLVSLLAGGDALVAGESILAELHSGPNSTQLIEMTTQLPSPTVFPIQVGPLTAAMHLIGAPGPFTEVTAATLTVDLYYDNLLGPHDVTVIVGLSRIGTSVAGDPPTVV